MPPTAIALASCPSDEPFWGRGDAGRLSDVVEWRQWFRLLTERSLAWQERGEPGTSGGEKAGEAIDDDRIEDGDMREVGAVRYWRWKAQYLVRYLTFPAEEDYEEQDEGSRDPAVLLVHRFAASPEQWERLVRRVQCTALMRLGRPKPNGARHL